MLVSPYGSSAIPEVLRDELRTAVRSNVKEVMENIVEKNPLSFLVKQQEYPILETRNSLFLSKIHMDLYRNLSRVENYRP